MNIKSLGIIAIGIGGVYGFQQVDKAMYYEQTQAVLKSVEFECTVENSKRHLEYKSTGKKAYMDCDLAKGAAKHHGYKENDIRLHANLEYSWVSPADGSTQMKEHRTRVHSRSEYQMGQTIQIYAHKEDPSKTYFK